MATDRELQASAHLVRVGVDLLSRQVSQEANDRCNGDTNQRRHLCPITSQDTENVDLHHNKYVQETKREGFVKSGGGLGTHLGKIETNIKGKVR